jgi:hypothetical protein
VSTAAEVAHAATVFRVEDGTVRPAALGDAEANQC